MNSAKPLKIAIVDDHRLIRKSLILLINTFDNIDVVVEAENGRVLFDKLETTEVELVLLDIEMPVMDGYQTSVNLHKLYPEIKILIISQFMTKECVHKALEFGAHGYVTKSSNPDQLETAIRSVHERGFYFDPELGPVLHDLYKGNAKPVKPKNPLSNLTDREMEIVRISAKGLNTAEIADKLCITVRTVETHRKRIIEKAEAKNFTGIILQALKYGYVSVSEL